MKNTAAPEARGTLQKRGQKVVRARGSGRLLLNKEDTKDHVRNWMGKSPTGLSPAKNYRQLKKTGAKRERWLSLGKTHQVVILWQTVNTEEDILAALYRLGRLHLEIYIFYTYIHMCDIMQYHYYKKKKTLNLKESGASI